jgi:hypothetical protein
MFVTNKFVANVFVTKPIRSHVFGSPGSRR